MKKKKSNTSSDKAWYVKLSRVQDISGRVDWNNPLDLKTILHLSKYGLLKEKKAQNPKAA